MEKHIPVLLNEVIENLAIKPDGTYVDLTIGRGGHSREILKRLSPKGRLIGFDQDEEAIKECESLKNNHESFLLIHDNFVNLKSQLENIGVTKVDGFLFDLGVSSPQFDDVERGFSYKGRARLDMRMDLRNSLTAETIVNEYSLQDLTRIFREFGEEKYSYNIAKKIVNFREKNRIEFTDQLVDIIKSALPMKELAKKGHPAKQVFQALRIEVNSELEVLKKALRDSISMLDNSGRLAVITFHSLEDRIVKEIFREFAVLEGNRNNDFIAPKDIKKAEYELVNKKVIVASEKELAENNRSHSAKLRVLARI